MTFWARARRFFWSWWPWAIVSIWAISDARWGWAIGCAVMAIVSYLITPAADPPRFGLDHKFAVESSEFASTMAGASGNRFLPGNHLELLKNGDAFYPAMLAAIKNARSSITIEAYIYWAGRIGQEFAVALAEQATAGRPVKLLLDAIGSSNIGPEILDLLEAGGCQIAWYNPIRWYSLGRFNNRTHRKSLIIDGQIAFTGGAGIADHWRGNARGPDEWRDLQVRVEGPAVVPLQTGFAHNQGIPGGAGRPLRGGGPGFRRPLPWPRLSRYSQPKTRMMVRYRSRIGTARDLASSWVSAPNRRSQPLRRVLKRYRPRQLLPPVLVLRP